MKEYCEVHCKVGYEVCDDAIPCKVFEVLIVDNICSEKVEKQNNGDADFVEYFKIVI